MNQPTEDILMHYGTKRHSGRYPYGSGEDPYQHGGDFLSRVDELRAQGITYTDENGKVYTGDTAVAKTLGLTTGQFRVQVSRAVKERRGLMVERAKNLKEKGYSLNEIARQMGFENDSSVRSLLNEDSERRMRQAEVTAQRLKELVDEKGMIDVAAGAEKELGVSEQMLKQALYNLELDGYPTYGGGIPQVTNPGRQTNVQVLCPPGTPHKDIYKWENVHSVAEGDYISKDGGMTFEPRFVYPKSMDSKRMKIRYAEEDDGHGHTGIERDGVIEIRPGVQDLSLGNSSYAQVRILVDGTHYMKGMAVYSDNMPDGVDVVFNTNKSAGTPPEKVLKEIKKDPQNPFGSLIKDGVSDSTNLNAPERGGQSYYIDKNGKKQLSLINKRAEEGDWGSWSDHLPSQFLSKQKQEMIDKQLALTAADKQMEFDEICALTNPTVKKNRLKSFADDCDASSVHLKAAALPGQKYQVIIPIPSLKDTEVYAPNYADGEKVALIRYPHGGTFEIPILTVNNKQRDARKILGMNPADAIGINKNVADRLSGADFDGDTVMVIPTAGNGRNNKVKITSTDPLEGLKGFDPKLEYGGKQEGTFKPMRNTQNEMGKISNLITDMTLKGATNDELARAVRHSMVVIDAEKHNLDYKQSERDNGIAALKKKYQGTIDPETGKYHEGSATLISKAKSPYRVNKRKGSAKVNKETGEVSYKEVYETYTDKNGKTQVRRQESTKMAETKDAFTLSSGTPQENAYAAYANKMKALANAARKEIFVSGKVEYNKNAAEAYANEVSQLKADLNIALKNAPRERQAQRLANTTVNGKKQANPDMTKEELKKARQQALSQARAQVGAKRYTIPISDKQWEAIQAGAISENILSQILDHADSARISQLATPRARTQLSPAKINKMEAMRASGYTTEQIATSIGCSSSTVSKYLTKGVS